MEIGQPAKDGNVPAGRRLPNRPALKQLIDGMERRLSHRQQNEIARMGRRAKAARAKWLRRLTNAANAEAKRLLESAQ
jgi:hypothetical protein